MGRCVQSQAHQRGLWPAIDHVSGGRWRMRAGVARMQSLGS